MINNLKINNNLKEKLKKTKYKLTAVALGGVLGALTIIGGINKISDTIATKTESNESFENAIGFTDINRFLNLKVNKNNFVILNAGDSKKVGVSHLEDKLKYCNEHDIAAGIIIEPTSININDIYDDVELVKGIINEYSITFPVYLNIDPIIENNDIDNDTKIKTIKTFLDKCTSNGIYCGVYGKDTNLVYLNKYCKITEFDACVVMDKEEIEYSGSFMLYQDVNRKIKANTNLEKVITNNGLNTPERLKNDFTYTVQEGDILLEIAMRYNMSINALLKYNEITEEEFKPGITLRIPSSLEVIAPTNSGEKTYPTLEEPILGCDMSYAQTNVNWNTIKENFDFVILKCSQGTNKDSLFETHAKNCSINNIPIGVYCYNGCRGIDYKDNETFEKAIREQLNKCLEIIANKDITYPVYFDLEVRTEEDIKEIYTPEQIRIMLSIWEEEIPKYGYVAGLYCNKTGYKYISECYDTSNLEKWISGGVNYNSKVSFEEVQSPSQTYSFDGVTYSPEVQQSYQFVKGAGASNDNGYLDVDYSFVDYANPIYSNEEQAQNDLYIKEIERTDYSDLFIPAIIGTSGVVASVGVLSAGAIKHKKKRRNRRYRKINGEF